MEPYGAAHLVMIAVFVAGVPLAALLGRRDRRTDGRVAGRALALLLLVATVPLQLYDALTRFELGVSLPLHLCDLTWPAAAIALWTRQRWAVGLTYYWGLALTSQGIVTPSLGEAFPDVRFFAFWALHLLIVWSAIYLVWGLGLAPRWQDYRTALAVTLSWVLGAYLFNLAADTNYGYLVRKPSSGSALDLLGPWPVYVVAEVAIVAAVWALMTWPFNRRSDARAPA